ncbi:MAG: hypothetical protein ACYCXA_11835 [Actinomycetes bacterium]
MTKSRTWVAGAVVVALLLVVAGWFLLIAPQRSQASALAQENTAAVQNNGQLRMQIASLAAQAKNLPLEQAQLATMRQQIPLSPGLPSMIRSLVSIAASSGVVLQSITPSSPTALPASAANQSVAGTGAASANTAAARVKAIGMSLTVGGTYFQVEKFLNSLEQLQRAFQVTGLNVAPGSATSTASSRTAGTPASTGSTVTSSVPMLTASITGRVFMVQATTTTPGLTPAPAGSAN